VFDELTDFVIFGGQLFYALAVGAVFVLRRKYPDRPRPYRTWGYPVTPLIYLMAFAAAIVSLLLGKPVQTLAGSVLIVAGVVYYRIRNYQAATTT
jgi:APA family basic amino acid/polyamine antiporter